MRIPGVSKPARAGAAFAAVAFAALLAGCTQQTITTTSGGQVVTTPSSASDPRSRARARTELAAAYFDRGALGVALEEVKRAIEADANYAPAHNMMGLVQSELKDSAAAQASFERALSIDPNDADTNHNFGWFLCQSGREAQSAQYFMNAVRNPLYERPARSHAAAGICLARLVERGDEALGHLDRALRLDPNIGPALIPYARLQLRRGELETARATILRYNNQFTPTAESLGIALRVERARGDARAEAALGEQLRRRFPESPEAQALQRGQF